MFTTKEELKDIFDEDYDYAIKTIIFFAIEELITYGGLKEYSEDFIRPQEDAIETTFIKLDELEIDYKEEYKLAEEQLIKIVNAFIKQWNSNLINNLLKEDKLYGENILFLMVMSAYGHGTGLWEYIGEELGHYNYDEEYLYIPSLENKLLKHYGNL